MKEYEYPTFCQLRAFGVRLKTCEYESKIKAHLDNWWNNYLTMLQSRF